MTRKEIAVHGGLFVAACATTFLSGWLSADPDSGSKVLQGVQFAATLMGILLCHEMGHYVVARRHRIDVSLPYFIPMIPFLSFGTLGAVIKMRQPIADRDALLDVGAAGPLAGLAVAVPLLFVGLSLSDLGPIWPDSTLEGNSLFYLAAKALVFGKILPSGSTDVQLHPIAWGAWVGILVTMINLIPIGQLDGGHVMRAWLGDRHEQLSGRLHKALLAVAATVLVAMFAIATSRGIGTVDALEWAAPAAMPWVVWAVLLQLLRRAGQGVYHPPVGGGELSPGRRRLALCVLVVFLLILTPVPMVPAL